MHPPIHLAAFFLPFIHPCLRPVLTGLPLRAGSHPWLLRRSGALGGSRGAELETGGRSLARRSPGCQRQTARAPSDTCGAALKGFFRKVDAGGVATAPRMGALSFWTFRCLPVLLFLLLSQCLSVCLLTSPLPPSHPLFSLPPCHSPSPLPLSLCPSPDLCSSLCELRPARRSRECTLDCRVVLREGSPAEQRPAKASPPVALARLAEGPQEGGALSFQVWVFLVPSLLETGDTHCRSQGESRPFTKGRLFKSKALRAASEGGAGKMRVESRGQLCSHPWPPPVIRLLTACQDLPTPRHRKEASPSGEGTCPHLTVEGTLPSPLVPAPAYSRCSASVGNCDQRSRQVI